MKNYNFLILAITLSALFFCIAAQSDCQSKNRKEQIKNTNTKKNTPEKILDEEVSQPNQTQIKTLDEGANSNIENPFIFVVRSSETYAQLQSFAPNLPIKPRQNFYESAIVAVFAGTKNTGGYSVEITKTLDEIAVKLVAPPKDAMTAQALTTPYKIVVIPIKDEDNLLLNVEKNWRNAAQTYKITSGEFEYSGGIAGRAKKFDAEGTISLLKLGDFATLIFDLSGKGAEKNRKLNATASGKIENEKIDLARLDAGTFSESPKPPVKVSGTLTNNILNLVFEPLPTNFADGFQLLGKTQAVKIKQN